MVLASYIHMMGLLIPSLHENRKRANARGIRARIPGVITPIGEDVQDFKIGDEVYGMNDWFADGATTEFCITLPQNIGPVRAVELK